MNLQMQFAAHVKAQHLWTAADKVVLAISTGVDSMVLWHLCRHLPKALRPQIILAYVDHHLRSASAQETAFITAQAAAYQTPLFRKDWWPEAHPTEGVEAAGRHFRYAFFQTVMAQNKSALLLTAHHQDDLAETILMKLTRSGDLTSAVGLKQRRPFANGQLVRPLLPFDKATIYAYAEAQKVPYFEDATNHEDAYLRNRIRHHILPQLKAENPQTLAHLAYFAESLDSVLTLNQTFLPQLYQQQGIETLPQGIKGSVTAFQQLPAASRMAFLQSLWATYFPERPLKAQQLTQILALLAGDKPQTHLDLAGGFSFERQYATYFIQKNHTLGVSKNQTFQLELNHWQPLPDHTEIGLFETIPTTTTKTLILSQWVDLATSDWPVTVRHRRTGDKYLLANGHHGKLKKLFIDRHVPQEQRQNFWLVFANKKLIWIPNFRSFQLFHSSETDKMKFVLCFKQRL